MRLKYLVDEVPAPHAHQHPATEQSLVRGPGAAVDRRGERERKLPLDGRQLAVLQQHMCAAGGDPATATGQLQGFERFRRLAQVPAGDRNRVVQGPAEHHEHVLEPATDRDQPQAGGASIAPAGLHHRDLVAGGGNHEGHTAHAGQPLAVQS
jgi:hypothetical protein